MTTQRHRIGNRLSSAEKRQTAENIPARRFQIQHEIQELQKRLSAFNERIAELEKEGDRGHAMEVSKANAMDFARQIDELRSLLIDAAPKTNEGKL
jgi:hypothetical protein